ncbi:MAG: hypothetical protein B6I38_11000 [Anaerolineaceae bacterium 4572_5.1]|nr:MAG: hypothetical protein B6I38_11000 [Anaerolineaceae bacterium 4572_5.1]
MECSTPPLAPAAYTYNWDGKMVKSVVNNKEETEHAAPSKNKKQPECPMSFQTAAMTRTGIEPVTY